MVARLTLVRPSSALASAPASAPGLDGASALADRVERLIAECVEMRERAAQATRSTHTLLTEARQLLAEARHERSRSWVRRLAAPRPAGLGARPRR